MTEPTRPYLLFHPKFISKYGNSWRKYGPWDFRQVRKSFDKKWWKAGCFAIDADMRRFELVEVESEGPAFIIGNIFVSKENVFLSTKHIFNDAVLQLNFAQAREIYVEAICKGRWWNASGENEQQFRNRNAAYVNWAEVIEFVSLAGRGP